MRGTVALILLVAMGALPSEAAPCPVKAWPVDPLIKVFRDAKPTKEWRYQPQVAAGEHATFQVVIRAEDPIEGLQAQCDPFRGAGSAIPPLPPRFVGYVPVDRPTQMASKDQPVPGAASALTRASTGAWRDRGCRGRG